MITTQPFGNRLTAGDTWQGKVCLPDYSSSDFALQYVLRKGESKLVIAGVAADDGGFTLTAASSDTAKLPDGIYGFALQVTDASENRTTVSCGTIKVTPDLASDDSASVDPRSFELRMLLSCEAILSDLHARVEEEYQINGRMLRLMDRVKLLAMRDDYKARVRSQEIASGQRGRNANTLRFGFGGPR